MHKEKELPEAVFCLHCNNGRAFHHLGGHLAHIHGTNQKEYKREFDLSPDEPLFSRQYSKNRSIIASNPKNIQRARRIILDWHDLKRKALDLFASQGLYTTGQASEITGLSINTFIRAIRENRLQAGQVCLIGSIEQDGEWKTVRLPAIPQAIITEYDVLKFQPARHGEITIPLAKQSIKALANSGFYTTGQASERTGLAVSTFRRTILEGRLQASVASLINIVEERGRLRCVKIPGPQRFLIERDNLANFANTRRKEPSSQLLLP